MCRRGEQNITGGYTQEDNIFGRYSKNAVDFLKFFLKDDFFSISNLIQGMIMDFNKP
jgi:hypothetical protein